MKLYYRTGACSLSSHILLCESGLPFTTESVDLVAKVTELGEDFLTINAKGQVPTLKLDDKTILTENIAIALYISDLVPEKKLIAPVGDINRYQAISWFNFIATELHKNFIALFYNPNLSSEAKVRIIQTLAEKFAIVEQQLKESDYLVNHCFSIADAFLFVMASKRSKVPELPVFSAIDKFMEKVGVRPSVQAAIMAEQNIEQ